MKRLAVITAALTISGAALAQEEHGDGHGIGVMGSASVESVWTEFETSCGSVLTDPAAFVTSHPAAAPDGTPLVVRSPDNQVLALYDFGPGWLRSFELIGVPGALQILCQVYGGGHTLPDDIGAAEAAILARVEEFKSFVAARADTVLVGGPIPPVGPGGFRLDMFGVDISDHIYGIQTDLGGEPRFVYAKIEGGDLSLVGLYAFTGAPKAADAPEAVADAGSSTKAATADTSSASKTMRAAIEACLRNYRTPGAALPALEEIGLTLTPGMDAGAWDFHGAGVNGVVVAGRELYCSIQSSEVSLDTAKALSADLAFSLFPEMVQVGAPEGGKGPCDGYSIFAPRQLIWMRYAQAGNSGECINDGTSAIIIN